MHKKSYYIYMMTNTGNTVLYTGMTNNLLRRVSEHKNGRGAGFTSRYQVTKLVYFESTESVGSAIAREKQIKAGSRRKKLELVEKSNKEWKDLSDDLV